MTPPDPGYPDGPLRDSGSADGPSCGGRSADGPLPDRATLSVRSPADLIAAIPYLLGFHPAGSLVIVGMRDARIVFAARYDLPAPDEPPERAAGGARHVAAVVSRQGVDAATLVGYGPAAHVTPHLPRLAGVLRAAGVTVLDELRVTDGRYWSYTCQDPSCCPPEGTACHPAASVVAAAATFAGQVALPDRATLVAQLAPVDGADRAAMRRAMRRADEHLVALLRMVAPSDVVDGRVLRRAGAAAVRAAMRRHRDGGRLTDDETAWLGVLLRHLLVRDFAWERIGDDDWHVRLWTDVVRRVEPEYLPAPASLLAFAAWRAGQGALAAVALGRAREQDPDYPMAVLLDEVLRHGLPPSRLDGWPGTDRPGRRPRRGSGRRRRRRRVRA